MYGTFLNCEGLTRLEGLVIPNSVIDMSGTFYCCGSLTVTINVLTNYLDSYDYCFEETTKPITLIGTGSNDNVLELLAGTSYGNVTY